MPRPQERVCLNDGLRLDINSLLRRGYIFRDCANHRGREISWTSSYWGVLASAKITYDLGRESGWMRVHVEGDATAQLVNLTTRPRRFGGRQWYFECPSTGRPVSVLWRPSGATRFHSRQALARRAAYRSQFLNPGDLAHRGQSEIKRRLLSPGMDPDEWELPPKPKGMRWRTYHRHVQRFDHYGGVLDGNMEALAVKLLARYGPA